MAGRDRHEVLALGLARATGFEAQKDALGGPATAVVAVANAVADGHITVVPEVRWLKHPTNMEFLAGETIDHYADHEADLVAILAAAGEG